MLAFNVGTRKPTRANMSEDIVNTLLKRIFTEAGYVDATPYSMRKSAAKWFAMSGALEWEIANGGRWISDSWRDYVQTGMFEDQFGTLPRDLLIRKMWVWRCNTYELKAHREVVSIRHHR